MGRLGVFAIAVLTAVAVSALASTASAAGSEGSVAPAQTVGTVDVQFKLNRFVREGRSLIARGTAVATFRSPDGQTATASQPFSAKAVLPARWVRSPAASNRICQVLFLELAPLRLNLLGLIVEIPEPVTLRITANSRGGILGSLLCSLANQRLSTRALSSAARELTVAARQSGLSTSGISFAVPLGPQGAQAALAICEVLDLVLGPLDLQVLGLRVELSRVHLRITADSEGGILGSLFCSLAGGTLPPLPIP